MDGNRLRISQQKARQQNGNPVVGVGIRVPDLPLYILKEIPVEEAYALSHQLTHGFYAALLMAWVRIEEMMIQSEKMLSIEGLAAGMAHEINNPLAGMLQNVQGMRNRMVDDIPRNKQAAEACGLDSEARVPGTVYLTAV